MCTVVWRRVPKRSRYDRESVVGKLHDSDYRCCCLSLFRIEKSMRIMVQEKGMCIQLMVCTVPYFKGKYLRLVFLLNKLFNLCDV